MSDILSPAPARSRLLVGDIVTTALLVLVQFAGVVVELFIFGMSAMATDVCAGDSDRCDDDTIGVAATVLWTGTAVAIIFTVAGCLTRIGQRRPAFWVPIVGLGAQITLTCLYIHLVNGATSA